MVSLFLRGNLLTIYMHHLKGSVYEMHKTLLEDYKKGKNSYDVQLIICDDMF